VEVITVIQAEYYSIEYNAKFLPPVKRIIPRRLSCADPAAR
jgi:hypothetical protein